MSRSPFAFYRGAASVMAADLQSTPASGLRIPIAGDAHLANFGVYASPERRLVFDLDDFDEAFEGPWEWDVKRLAASVTIAARHAGLRRREAREATLECVRSYVERTREYAERRQLAVWYAAIGEDRLGGLVSRGRPGARDADPNHPERALPKFAELDRDGAAIVDDPPLVFHPPDRAAFLEDTRRLYAHYLRTLTRDRRALLDRFRLIDAAYEVVGVGSVGTRCVVALLLADAADPLFLQIKEARASAYERYAPGHAFADHGERVVSGQRLMQARSDIFLGWARSERGFDFYVRQIADRKAAIDIETMDGSELARYAGLCGWALARAHARASGRAGFIAGYAGRGDAFPSAIERFAESYADRNEADYETLVAAVRTGAIAVRHA